MFMFAYDGDWSFNGDFWHAVSFSFTSLLIFIGVLGFITVTYFAPTMVAYVRRHRHIFWIFMVNLLGGFTMIGWLIAFFWSLSRNTRDQYDY